MQKTHRNIQCVVTLLPSVQLWLKLDSYCSCITKLPVHTARMSRGMDMGYHFFYYRCDQGLLSAPLNYKGMDTCPGIATQCLLSGGILHTQGWRRQNVSGNCCEKHLRVIPSGNSLSNVLFTVMKESVLPVPPTSDLGREKRTSSWQAVNFLHCLCAEDFILIAQRSQAQDTPTILFLFYSLYIARKNTVNLISACIPKELHRKSQSWLKEYCRKNRFRFWTNGKFSHRKVLIT